MTDDVTPPSRFRSSAPTRYLGAGLYLLLACAVAMGATQSSAGERIDERGARSFGSHARWWMHHIDGLTTPLLCVMGLAALAGVCTQLVRGGWSVAIRAVILIAGMQSTVECAKHVIHREDGMTNTLPSGHTSLVLSLALAIMVVWPQRAVAVIVCAVASFVGFGTVVGGWHRPSDVIVAAAVAAVWMQLIGFVEPRSVWVAAFATICGMVCAGAGLVSYQVDVAPALVTMTAVGVSIFMVMRGPVMLGERR